MIRVNGKELEWHEGLAFEDLYQALGYTIKTPRVIIRVNGETVKKNQRDGFAIPDNADIEIINALCGG